MAKWRPSKRYWAPGALSDIFSIAENWKEGVCTEENRRKCEKQGYCKKVKRWWFSDYVEDEWESVGKNIAERDLKRCRPRRIWAENE